MTAEWSGQHGPTWPAGVLRAFQVAGLAGFSVVLAAAAAATCVLSYAGVHAVAEQGGIQARYARGYPLLIDAILVIVLAAVLALRRADLPVRILSWLTLLVLLVAAAGAEALHAIGRRLPRDAAAITVAVLPWLLVFVAFLLLLAMLRHARLRLAPSTVHSLQAPTRPLPLRTPQPWNSGSIAPGISSRLVSGAAAGAAAGRAAAGRAAPERAPALGGGSTSPAGPEPPGDAAPAARPGAGDVTQQADEPGG